MTTLAHTRRAVKPSRVRTRPAEPFAAGLVDLEPDEAGETWPDEFTPELDLPWIALAPEPAPAPAPRPATPDGIPAKVARIRVVDGALAGPYRRVLDMGGWAPHWRPEAGGPGWMAEADADKLYLAGRVAILADAPPPPAPAFDLSTLPALADSPAPPPANRRTGRMPFTAADVAWEAGHSAGLADGDPTPPAGLSEAESAAWLAGFDQGWATYRERADDELIDRLALEAEWNELAEARMAPAHSTYRD